MRHIKPELATLVDQPFDRKGWIFEIKWDGFRTLADMHQGHVELYSRNLLPFNELFAPIHDSLKKSKADMLLDGEVVILDPKGRSNFQLLQNYQRTAAPEGRASSIKDGRGKGHLVYYVFDLLRLKGKSTMGLPLEQRKKLLKQNLPKLPNVKYSDHIEERGVAFFKAAQKQNLEGIIAKDFQSPYRPGRRTMDWLKIKTQLRQEAVIGGFTEPLGSRKFFGSLILGVYERGKFKYIGHSGGGFDEETLKSIYHNLKPLVKKESPFATKVPNKAKPYWVKPKFVCEVAFSEWTTEGQMRHPVFLGLRPDKNPKQVHIEKPN